MSSDSRKPALLAAVRELLRPLATLLIQEQIPFAAIAEMLKSTLVERAVRSFRLPGKRTSDSRITLLTGIHRKDVKRLRAELERGAEQPTPVSLSARLIADWNARSEFLDADGRPRPLYRSSARGRPSVRDLTETAGRDIRPQSIVEEWLRQGVVVIDEENRVRLKHYAFVPEHDFEEKARFFGRNLGAHVAAAAHNLRGEGEPLLDQGVYYGGLTPESCERLEKLARALAMDALRALNREAYELQQADDGDPDATRRIHFGTYFDRQPAPGRRRDE